MKVSTENDNNFGYEKITILAFNMIWIKYYLMKIKKITFLFYDLSRVCNKIGTTGITSWILAAYPSGAPEFTPGF